MSHPGAQQRIQKELATWQEVTAHPHRFGGTEFRLGSREIGHIHGESIVDIPFPIRVRDQVVAAGQAKPHHALPESGWVTVPLEGESGILAALERLRRSYDLARAQAAKRRGQADNE